MVEYNYHKRKRHWGWLLTIPLILVLLALAGFYWYRSSLEAPSTEGTQVVFVIQPNESVPSIAKRLQEEGVIKNSLVFRFFLKLNGLDSNIQVGDFKLRKNMTAAEVAENLHSGVVDIWVTLLEGWRVEEMGRELKRKLGLSEAQFINEAKEGYMFPDTYLIPKDATVEEVISLLKNNFDKRLKENGLTPTSGTTDLTYDEKVILASIVERESKGTLEEKSTIAGILLNRLNIGMALQADATIQYDLGNDGNWWPKLTQADYALKTPYSTYARPGLPPGPISNPGINSLRAAFNPKDTDFLYYIHGSDGKAYYAKTLEEHNANIANHLN